MGSKYVNDYSDVDWEKELNEYFASQPMPIRQFVIGKPYSYWAIRDKLRKDERYICKWKKETDETVRLTPVIVDESSLSLLIRINGFDLEISCSTDSEALRAVLEAMRKL